ncbi:hypothetical protein ACQEVB_22925 [Pseudonocardia sp. CA-107938]|uniref:hypothetical protein n=1 Tax=Pseudonocardia sp. CA-107938 TaxID=3240021 RepID=UPI003D8E4227
MTRNRHAAPSARRIRRDRARGGPASGIVGGIAGCAGVALSLLLVTAACGSTVQSVPAREAPPVGGAAQAAAATPGLATATTPLGTVVTVDGYTVYRFDKDSADPSRSTCTGDCAKAWPPVLGDGIPKLTGLPADQIGTVGRPDGTQQLTLAGWPLYRSAKDTKPGSTAGEGVGGTWRAIGVDGKPAAKT